MIPQQKYNFHNKNNFTGVLISAQNQSKLVDHLSDIKGLVDHRKPKSKNFAHMVPKNRFWGELPRPEAVRQKDIDH